MGISIVRKTKPGSDKRGAKIALVLAGGAVSGGAFKIGGLIALNNYLLNRKITEFDIYVGLSAGALLSAPLAGDISPEEMLKSINGTSKNFGQLKYWDFYYPNVKDIIGRPIKFIVDLMKVFPQFIYDLFVIAPNLFLEVQEQVKKFINTPSYSNLEKILEPIANTMISPEFPNPLEYLPSGFFDNKRLEKFLRENIKRNNLANDFIELYRKTGKELFITATNLDTAERVVFGHNERNDVTISEAVQASTALPGFYKPARIRGIDYVDGGIRRTANIDVAYEHGAELIICYNPFRPIYNEIHIEYIEALDKYSVEGTYIADKGILSVLNQVFRTLLHTRLEVGLQRFKYDPSFNGDIILIEPTEDDVEFFNMNPVAFWNRAKAAKKGFESVIFSIEEEYDEIKEILKPYGLEITKHFVRDYLEKLRKVSYSDEAVLDILEQETPPRKLKII